MAPRQSIRCPYDSLIVNNLMAEYKDPPKKDIRHLASKDGLIANYGHATDRPAQVEYQWVDAPIPAGILEFNTPTKRRNNYV